MQTIQQTSVEPTPQAPRSGRRLVFVSGVLLGALVLVAVAFFFGPRSSALMEDPLTGRQRHESSWLGFTLTNQTVENETSNWAEQNSIKGVYPGQYGWNTVTQTRRGWFSGGVIACGGGFDIPRRIFSGRIAVEGSAPEQVLQQFQAELIAAFNEHETTISTQRRWAEKDSRP